jgi:hypothetical protein
MVDSLGACYFSAVTQLTIGYGEKLPKDFLRLLVVIQATIGLFFTVLIFARFVSFLPRSESILGDHDKSNSN